VLDKNPDLIIDNNLMHIKKEFGLKNPNIMLCSEPFDKIEFLDKLINSIEYPIIFVDMDLLYTGYIKSKMIQKKENVLIISPNKTNWNEKFLEIISRISKKKFLVIFDSFNGIYNLFDDLESVRFINSCIMLLSFIGNQSDTSIVVTTMARKKEDSKWVLSPGGKHIIKSEKTGIYFLKKNTNDLLIINLEKANANLRTFKIEQ